MRAENEEEGRPDAVANVLHNLRTVLLREVGKQPIKHRALIRGSHLLLCASFVKPGRGLLQPERARGVDWGGAGRGGAGGGGGAAWRRGAVFAGQGIAGDSLIYCSSERGSDV